MCREACTDWSVAAAAAARRNDVPLVAYVEEFAAQ